VTEFFLVLFGIKEKLILGACSTIIQIKGIL